MDAVTLTVRDRHGIKKVGTYTGATAEEAWDAFRDNHGEYRIISADRLTFPRMRSVEFTYTITES